ncbi:MAG TPA: hypothetical protein PLC22_03990 [Gordonia sp. (in: high G+C Gram-positive bacteria)]|jgi:hypothetical protein|uniref:hypothetical protein n=1 Tax=Gordonia sp. (in: high G+C Gram-positive bacteria) TaxID=84139 RepID=UPI0025C0FB14|nr:hypothetical protein [Gordonia sp. (in: high G+C Gram-positive bacteria)]HMS76707.1 hypothetical protein [Gordonia sp. (in: high G+C Gram-positive bacteria)]HQV17469.1 hypothetical protein [Gordonia sp. (in: high G+C Gram-positive bacteria)]
MALSAIVEPVVDRILESLGLGRGDSYLVEGFLAWRTSNAGTDHGKTDLFGCPGEANVIGDQRIDVETYRCRQVQSVEGSQRLPGE